MVSGDGHDKQDLHVDHCMVSEAGKQNRKLLRELSRVSSFSHASDWQFDVDFTSWTVLAILDRQMAVMGFNDLAA